MNHFKSAIIFPDEKFSLFGFKMTKKPSKNRVIIEASSVDSAEEVSKAAVLALQDLFRVEFNLLSAPD